MAVIAPMPVASPDVKARASHRRIYESESDVLSIFAKQGMVFRSSRFSGVLDHRFWGRLEIQLGLFCESERQRGNGFLLRAMARSLSAITDKDRA